MFRLWQFNPDIAIDMANNRNLLGDKGSKNARDITVDMSAHFQSFLAPISCDSTFMPIAKFRINQKGFSMLELAMVMAVLGIIMMAITPSLISMYQIKASEKAAQEILFLQASAKTFYQQQGKWPKDIDDLKKENLISRSWDGLNPWQQEYLFNSSAAVFNVTTQIPELWIKAAAKALTQVSINKDRISSAISMTLLDADIDTGMIVAWSGQIADIPQGWWLCDGSHGTPDLRNRFIIGAAIDDGNESKTTVLNRMDKSGGSISHDHGGKTGEHQLTIAQMPKHHHGYKATPWTGARYDGHSSPLMTEMRDGITEDEGGDEPHSHPLNSDFHVPPFYALAFIMKL